MPLLPLTTALAVGRYRRELDTLSPAALRRTLRDTARDARVKDAIANDRPLNASTIRVMVRAYQRALEQQRAEVESRLAERQAEAGAFRAQWTAYLDEHDLRDRAVKVWHTQEDERVRDAHAAMQDQEVPFDALFLTEDTGWIWGPPQAFNCRCWIEVVVLDDADESTPER